MRNLPDVAASDSKKPRVHLYLDIDGVLNAYVRHALPDYQSHWEGGYQPHPVKTKVYYAPAMVAAINALIADHGAVAHWLTTWERHAPAFGEEIGLAGSGDWPVLAALSGPGSGWPKFASIRDHVTATKPDVAVWIDDDLATEHPAREWAEQHDVLAIAPGPLHGIEPKHIESIRARIATASRINLADEIAELRDAPQRDPARIQGVLDAIQFVWTRHPDLRLTQIIRGTGAGFDTEDDEFVERLLGIFKHHD